MGTRKRMKTRSSRKLEVENLNLLFLPHLVQDRVLSFLTISEQLNARLVCKTLKSWVDQKSAKLAEHIPCSFVRYHAQNSFKIFRRQHIQHVITHLYCEDDTLAMFDDPTMPQFVKEHACGVSSLMMKRYFICSSNGKQTSFLESFPNLHELEFDEVWIANANDMNAKVPDTFRSLKLLKLGQVKVYNEPNYDLPENYNGMPNFRKSILRWNCWNLLDKCTRLNCLRVPILPQFLFNNAFEECFYLLNYIRKRTNGITPSGFGSNQHVMQCDIKDFTCSTSSLEVLMVAGARMRIQFLNVNSKIFKRGSPFSLLLGAPHIARFNSIFSFVSSSLVNQTFEYVQKLTFRASLIKNECLNGRKKGPVLFPSLKEFTIILDIGSNINYPTALYSRQANAVGQRQITNVCLPRADQMLLIFFPADMPYQFVHTASIIIQDPVFENQRRLQLERLKSLPNIVACFPNARNLTLSGWNCKRNTYFLLWHGLPQLERLTLENCTSLIPSCFIDGNGNHNNPGNFRFLPELKFLEFIGLENMPGVANEQGLKPQMADALLKKRLLPFHFLTRNDLRSRTSTWIQSIGVLNPFSFIPNSSIVTRSISKAMMIK